MQYVTASKKRIAWEMPSGAPEELRTFAVARCGGIEEQNTGKIIMETSPLVIDRLVAEGGIQRHQIDDGVYAIYHKRKLRRAALVDAANNNTPFFKDNLFKTQYSGVRFLQAAQRGLILDETGTGKTTLAGVLAQTVTSNKQKGRILVVCPKSSRLGWEAELRSRVGYTGPIIIPRGERVDRLEIISKLPNHCVVILNWEMLSPKQDHPDKVVKRRLEAWAKDWLRFITDPGTWQVVIGDEIHRAKNRETDQSTNLFELAKTAPYAVGLSATPTDGKAHEWFGVLRYVDPWRFTAYHRFFDMFTDWYLSWDGRYKEIRRDNGHNGAKNTPILDDVVADYAIRRLPGIESGIPPIRRKRIIVEMDGGQRAAYEEMLNLYKLSLQSGAELHAPNVLSQQTRLRQILVHPAIVGANGSSAKINAALEILADLDNGHNVVVYCTLVNSLGSTDAALLKFIERRIKTELHGQWDVRLLYSATTEDERHAIEDWLREGKGRVVVLSAQTGGTSLNLQGADIGIFIDRPWSSTLNHQCEGRLPRPGSDAPYVLLIDIVCANSLDGHVMALLEDKQGFNEHRFGELMAHYILNGGE